MNTHLRIAERLTELLEDRFTLFGFKFGLDPIIGLLFGAGDMVTLVVGMYYIWIAKRLSLPDAAIARMMGNIMLDFLIGMIPFIGDLFDFSFKAHSKNWQILQSYTSLDDMKEPLDRVRTT